MGRERARDADAASDLREVRIPPGPLDEHFSGEEGEEGGPVVLDGVEVDRLFRVNVAGKRYLHITFLHVDSEVRQAIALRAPERFIDTWTGSYFTLWSETSPRTRRLPLRAGAQEIEVWSKFGGKGDYGHAWKDGHAIHMEEIAPGRLRFYCSDGRPDGRLDKLVFELELEDEPQAPAPAPPRPGLLARLFGTGRRG